MVESNKSPKKHIQVKRFPFLTPSTKNRFTAPSLQRETPQTKPQWRRRPPATTPILLPFHNPISGLWRNLEEWPEWPWSARYCPIWLKNPVIHESVFCCYELRDVNPRSLTASLPLKNGGWETSLSYCIGKVTFQGRAVKLRGGILRCQKNIFKKTYPWMVSVRMITPPKLNIDLDTQKW